MPWGPHPAPWAPFSGVKRPRCDAASPVPSSAVVENG